MREGSEFVKTMLVQGCTQTKHVAEISYAKFTSQQVFMTLGNQLFLILTCPTAESAASKWGQFISQHVLSRAVLPKLLQVCVRGWGYSSNGIPRIALLLWVGRSFFDLPLPVPFSLGCGVPHRCLRRAPRASGTVKKFLKSTSLFCWNVPTCVCEREGGSKRWG